MRWNWQQSDWPNFAYASHLLDDLEHAFVLKANYLRGMLKHLDQESTTALEIDFLSEEAYKTSEIEGEYLNRDSLRSSIKRYLKLPQPRTKIPPKEQGIVEMLMHMQTTYAQPLTNDMLCHWHLVLLNMRYDLNHVGSYRTHVEPMQIVSGHSHKQKIHFEAPPSTNIPDEMQAFIKWFNDTAPHAKNPLPVLTRAAIAHFYFVCIHPFEDGNGRIARALVEKVLAQTLGHSSYIALSHTIQNNKKKYYAALEQGNKSNDITAWLLYFANMLLDPQDYTEKMIIFLIEKTKLYDRSKGLLNSRQEKVLARLFAAGIEGFEGGLSAEKYIRIADTSKATATRDLQDLVAKRLLKKIGKLKSTRYFLNIKEK